MKMEQEPNGRFIETDSQGLANNTEQVVIILEISREQIVSGNYAKTLERLMILTDTRENVLRYRESVFLQITGYDEDPRELPEIPEVRSFFVNLTNEWPNWLWFLGRETGLISLMMSLLCDCKIHSASGAMGIEFTDPDQLERRTNDLLARSLHMFRSHDIPVAEAQESARKAIHSMVG